MRYLSLLLALSMGGCAFGQSTIVTEGAIRKYDTVPLKNGVLLMTDSNGNITTPKCDSLVMFGATAKRVKNIFPEECQSATTVDLWNEPESSCTKHPSWCQTPISHAQSAVSAQEPIDIPAIQEKHPHQCTEREKACAVWNEGQQCPCIKYEDAPYYTCADTARILLTSEDGKKWCHRVQP